MEGIMRLEKRSEKMENFVEGVKEVLALAAMMAVMLAGVALLFAVAPK